MKTHFKVIRLTRLEIKFKSTAPKADALSTRLSELLRSFFKNRVISLFPMLQKRGLAQSGPGKGQLSESPLLKTTSSGAAWKAHDFAEISPRKTKFYLNRAKPVGRKRTKCGHGSRLNVTSVVRK